MSQVLGYGVGGSGGGGNFITASVQTVDDTPTNLYTFTLAANTAYSIRALVVGAQDDYSNAMGDMIVTTAYKEGVNDAVLLNSSNLAPSDSFVGGAAVPITFVEAGNDISIQVTGLVDTTINWRGFIEFVKLP